MAPNLIPKTEIANQITCTSGCNPLGKLSQVGIPAIVNIHNVELARRFATRIVGLSGGAVVFDDTPEALSDAFLKQIYGGESWLDGAVG